jgi:hypothetical protein
VKFITAGHAIERATSGDDTHRTSRSVGTLTEPATKWSACRSSGSSSSTSKTCWPLCSRRDRETTTLALAGSRACAHTCVFIAFYYNDQTHRGTPTHHYRGEAVTYSQNCAFVRPFIVLTETKSINVCVCVYYCRTYYKAVRGGEEKSGGHVL